MSTISIEVPDELSEQLALVGDRLPELLARSLRQPFVSAHVYRHILDFLASSPTPEQIASFGPTSEMTARLGTLLSREASGEITPGEKAELDEYEQIEHLIIMIKAGNLAYLTDRS